MIITIRIPAQKDTRYAPNAFESVIGTTTDIIHLNEALLALILNAEVVNNGRFVDLTLEV